MYTPSLAKISRNTKDDEDEVAAIHRTPEIGARPSFADENTEQMYRLAREEGLNGRRAREQYFVNSSKSLLVDSPGPDNPQLIFTYEFKTAATPADQLTLLNWYQRCFDNDELATVRQQLDKQITACVASFETPMDPDGPQLNETELRIRRLVTTLFTMDLRSNSQKRYSSLHQGTMDELSAEATRLWERRDRLEDALVLKHRALRLFGDDPRCRLPRFAELYGTKNEVFHDMVALADEHNVQRNRRMWNFATPLHGSQVNPQQPHEGYKTL